jgi:hypothetical protein
MPAWLAGVRVFLLGLAVVGVGPWPVPVFVALVAQAIDRGAFYAELEPSSPAGGMAAAIRRHPRAGLE